MYKARFTEAGAKRLGRPDLIDKEFEYEAIHPAGLCVDGVYYAGRRIAEIVEFANNGSDEEPDPGCVLITKPEGMEHG